MTEDSMNYRTDLVWIKPGHRLYPYLSQVCGDAKNLYNTTNFFIRQAFTACRQNGELQPLQHLVMDTMQTHLEAMNDRKKDKNKPYVLPTPDQPLVSYGFLDALFKIMEQKDYRALPAQCSQGIMKVLYQNWKSFFVSMKDYQKHPEKYRGKPNIPGYMQGHQKDIVFTNQDCVIKTESLSKAKDSVKDRKFLKFPKTATRLNIGKLGLRDGKLMQVRVAPSHGQFVVELVFACNLPEHQIEHTGIMGIDLGVDHLATIVTTTGSAPVLVKGKIIKSINQYYNKTKAHYLSILRQGKEPREGLHTSKRLERLHLKRYRSLKDRFHKASYQIVKLAMEQGVGTIVIGRNQGWKQSSSIGRRNNQYFCHIPHGMLISMIQYKAAAQGITVQVTEEAYTSKASFLDQDPLPRFQEGEKPTFSGKRIHRGLYRSKQGMIHADVNGAANIVRKVFPNVRARGTNGIEGLDGNQTINVSTPLVLKILK